MALVTLPTTAAISSIAFAPLDFGGTLQGPIGGTAQRVNRLGGRWRCDISIAPMTVADARKWAAALTRGLRNGVSFTIPQPTTPVGAPGSILIAGASQAGDSIAVDGGTPGYQVQAGQWFNITTGGNKYLYQAAEAVKLTSGAGTIEIEPPLRKTPADNDPVTFGQPVIEGLLVDVPSWEIDVNRIVQGFSFAIEEAR